LSRIKTLSGPSVRRISEVGKEKVCGGNDLPKSQVRRVLVIVVVDLVVITLITTWPLILAVFLLMTYKTQQFN